MPNHDRQPKHVLHLGAMDHPHPRGPRRIRGPLSENIVVHLSAHVGTLLGVVHGGAEDASVADRSVHLATDLLVGEVAVDVLPDHRVRVREVLEDLSDGLLAGFLVDLGVVLAEEAEFGRGGGGTLLSGSDLTGKKDHEDTVSEF